MQYKSCLTAILMFLIVIPGMIFSLDVPRLKARVNDYAGILSPSMAQQLENRLSLLEKTDSTQIVILTIPSLQGEALEQFSIKVAEKWKIGQKGKDNGVILLVARDDRKVRIEVGRGLEGKLTDLISGRIIRNTIIPHFKNGNYDAGVLGGITDIISVVNGQYTSAAAGTDETGELWEVVLTVLGVIILTLIVPIIFFVVFISKKSKILGGLTVCAIASCVAFVIHKAHPSSFSLIAIMISGIVGFFIGMLPGFWNLHVRGSWEGSGDSSFWSSSSGSSDSSSGSSSDSSSDSFSGGGGDFGGGGSSGSW